METHPFALTQLNRSSRLIESSATRSASCGLRNTAVDVGGGIRPVEWPLRPSCRVFFFAWCSKRMVFSWDLKGRGFCSKVSLRDFPEVKSRLFDPAPMTQLENYSSGRKKRGSLVENSRVVTTPSFWNKGRPFGVQQLTPETESTKATVSLFKWLKGKVISRPQNGLTSLGDPEKGWGCQNKTSQPFGFGPLNRGPFSRLFLSSPHAPGSCSPRELSCRATCPKPSQYFGRG